MQLLCLYYAHFNIDGHVTSDIIIYDILVILRTFCAGSSPDDGSNMFLLVTHLGGCFWVHD